MSILKKKSSDNFQAIDLLSSGKLYSPGIHCAYYSSLQLVIYFFYEYTGITEKQANVDMKSNKTGSHTYYLKELVTQIERSNSKNAIAFYKYFNVFKRKRTESDYYNIEITEENLKEAKKRAEKINEFLINTFENGKCENVYFI